MITIEILKQGQSVYCETGIGLFFTQPINTVSNIALFISAYFVYKLLREYHIKNLIIQILPPLVVLTAVGSMLWHGAPSLLTDFADTLPLSALVLISFFFLLDKLLSNKKLIWGIFFMFILTETPFMFGILPSINGFIPYLLAFIFGLFISVRVAGRYALFPQLFPILVVFAIALFFRTIDLTICSAFPIGTHFVWHILNALMVYLIIHFLIGIEERTKHEA